VNTAVDFLPAPYRARLGALRTRRERLWLAVPVALALLATDMALRTRVGIARDMAAQAAAHAASGELRGTMILQLAQRVASARQDLEEQVAPFAAPRLSPLIDALLVERPPGLVLQSLSCRQDPWALDVVPTIRVDASCTTADAFSSYLAALRAHPELPRMQCARTFAGPDAAIGFQLTSTGAAEAGR
jgi:hypothetical protein